MVDPSFETRRKADNQRKSGNIEGAIATLENYLETQPEDVKTRMLYANVLFYDVKNADKAMAQLDRILTDDPDYDDARRALITILKRKKKFNDETKRHFEYLLPKYPEDVDLLHSYGIFCREQLLDFTMAKDIFERCVVMAPDVVMYRLSYASSMINDFRMYDSGRAELQTILKMDPGNKDVQDALVRLSKRKYRGDKGPRKGFASLFVK